MTNLVKICSIFLKLLAIKKWPSFFDSQCIIRTPDFPGNFIVEKVRIIFEVLRYVHISTVLCVRSVVYILIMLF